MVANFDEMQELSVYEFQDILSANLCHCTTADKKLLPYLLFGVVLFPWTDLFLSRFKGK
jgi:hypothetical protein